MYTELITNKSDDTIAVYAFSMSCSNSGIFKFILICTSLTPQPCRTKLLQKLILHPQMFTSGRSKTCLGYFEIQDISPFYLSIIGYLPFLLWDMGYAGIGDMGSQKLFGNNGKFKFGDTKY